MSEHKVRMAAYGLPLRPNDKLTLLGIMARVSWDSWAGPVSASNIARTVGISDRSVKRSIKVLTEQGYIQREQSISSNGRDSASITRVITSAILGEGDTQTQEGDTQSQEGDTQSQGRVTHSHREGDTQSQGRVTHSHREGDTQSHHEGGTQSHLINQSSLQSSVQSSVQSSLQSSVQSSVQWGGPTLGSATPPQNRRSYEGEL